MFRPPRYQELYAKLLSIVPVHVYAVRRQTSSDRAGACVRVLEKANQLLLFEVH